MAHGVNMICNANDRRPGKRYQKPVPEKWYQKTGTHLWYQFSGGKITAIGNKHSQWNKFLDAVGVAGFTAATNNWWQNKLNSLENNIIFTN